MSERESVPGTFHCAEEAVLLHSVREAAIGKRDARHFEQDDDQAQHGEEFRVALTECDDFLLQRLLRYRQHIETDDVRRGEA